MRKAGDVRSEASGSGLGRAASAPLALKPARLPSALAAPAQPAVADPRIEAAAPPGLLPNLPFLGGRG